MTISYFEWTDVSFISEIKPVVRWKCVGLSVGTKAPSTRIRFCLKTQLFLCGYTFRPHVSRLRAVSRLLLNPKKAGAIDEGRERRSHSEIVSLWITIAALPLTADVDRARLFRKPTFEKSGNLGRGWARVQLWDRLGVHVYLFLTSCAPNDPITDRAPTLAPVFHSV